MIAALSAIRKLEITKFSDKYMELGAKEETFIIEFLNQLTVAYRAVNEEASDEDKLFGLQCINEMNHRLLNRYRDLQTGESWTTKELTIELVEHNIKLAPCISGAVGYAASHAFEQVGA
ncbi:MAG: hypothetical protein HRU20_27125 [Pseudomonadales bacterium]|nr:hypothetical protein [Pseudomonadales bacterium]